MDNKISDNVYKFLFQSLWELFIFYSLYRNAVRSDGAEGRTVPHTVPLRRGALQRHAPENCLWTKIFLFADARGDSTLLQQNAVLK
jgi:hypothetical protein